MLMGYREYARHRGVTLGAVQKAIRDGRISANADKKIESDVADRDWQDNTDASRVAMSALEQRAQLVPAPVLAAPAQPGPAAGQRGAASPPVGGEGDELAGSDRAANEYREHRATRERYQALKQQLEYEQAIGQLINVDDAKRIVYTSFRALRDAVMNVTARVKDQLAAENDPHVCEAMLEGELSAALAAIDVTKLLREEAEPEE